jgi:hypothetical protein
LEAYPAVFRQDGQKLWPILALQTIFPAARWSY